MAKNKGGRPPKYKTNKELEVLIDEYFKTDAFIGEGHNRMYAPTMSGLAFHLDMCRQTLLNYEGKEEFLDTIKDAKEFVLASKVENLNRKQTNTAGIIFDLCNNGGYSNKHNEQDKGTTIIINDRSKEITQSND